jgi:hypothetical protein
MSDNQDLHKLGFKLKFAYSMTGLFLGLACIIAGVVLGLAGVTSHTSWTASALGLSTNMTDATPGIIIFVVGIFFVWMTRFKVRAVTEHPQGPKFNDPPKREGSEEAPKEPTTGGAPQNLTGPSTPRYSSGGRTTLDYHTGPQF